MKNVILFFAFIALFFSGKAQSLSGNMNTTVEGEKVVMKYGNVDIYKGDKLIKSVLTDEMGNFSVKLDTGTYNCVLNYDGFPTLKKTIVVKGDEESDFEIDESKEGIAKLKREDKKSERYLMDSAAPAAMEEVRTVRTKGLMKVALSSYDSSSDGAGTSSFRGVTNSGALTAGEVNDFSKWSLWNTYKTNEFSSTIEAWKIYPNGRYTVQVQNDLGLPVEDVRVKLIHKGTVLFEARTDNTGKAELWASLNAGAELASGRLSFELEKNGVKEKMNRISNFERGINHLTFDYPCVQSQNVDVAFVFDATGSMGDELRYLQNEIKRIIFDSKKVDDELLFRFANVFYRDHGDEYLSKKMPFTRILTEANSYIDEQKAAGGGDSPEAVDAALEMAINELEWSETARARLLFIMLDAPPHKGDSVINKLNIIVRQAAKKGIRIIPIGASGMNKDTEFLMRTLALGTNGTYTFLTDDSGIGGSHLKPTTDKFKVETLNELMVRLIKTFTFMPSCDDIIKDIDLNYPDSLVQYPLPDTIRDSSNIVDTNNNVNIRWSYYPNPTKGIVNVVVDRDVSELYITDIMGKEIFQVRNLIKDRPKQFDLSQYPTGIYLIRYMVDDKWISGKIVLARN